MSEASYNTCRPMKDMESLEICVTFFDAVKTFFCNQCNYAHQILVWFFWSESKHWPLTKYHCFMFVVEWCSLGETMNMVSLRLIYFNSSVYIASCPNEYKLVGTETHFTCREQIWVPYIPKCIKDEGYDSGIDQTG